MLKQHTRFCVFHHLYGAKGLKVTLRCGQHASVTGLHLLELLFARKFKVNRNNVFTKDFKARFNVVEVKVKVKVNVKIKPKGRQPPQIDNRSSFPIRPHNTGIITIAFPFAC